MTLDSAADVAWMLKDAGVPVSYNGAASYGILDIQTAEFGGDAGSTRTKIHRLTIATGALSDLRIGGRIVVDALPYRIDDSEFEDGDGLLTVLTLARLS